MDKIPNERREEINSTTNATINATINATSVQSGSGLYLDFARPKPDQFTLYDVAQGLSRECRFSGQTKGFYSVAQHSVLVSLAVPKEYALYALFHDGSEAFLRDLATPLKKLLPDYQAMEAKIQAIVHEKVGLDPVVSHEIEQIIKQADLAVFAAERAQLMPVDARAWPCVQNVEPYEVKIKGMQPTEALFYFLDRHVSILTDTPFVKDRALWEKQHAEWLSRDRAHEVAPAEPPITRSRERAA